MIYSTFSISKKRDVCYCDGPIREKNKIVLKKDAQNNQLLKFKREGERHGKRKEEKSLICLEAPLSNENAVRRKSLAFFFFFRASFSLIPPLPL